MWGKDIQGQTISLGKREEWKKANKTQWRYIFLIQRKKKGKNVGILEISSIQTRHFSGWVVFGWNTLSVTQILTVEGVNVRHSTLGQWVFWTHKEVFQWLKIKDNSVSLGFMVHTTTNHEFHVRVVVDHGSGIWHFSNTPLVKGGIWPGHGIWPQEWYFTPESGIWLLGVWFDLKLLYA